MCNLTDRRMEGEEEEGEKEEKEEEEGRLHAWILTFSMSNFARLKRM